MYYSNPTRVPSFLGLGLGLETCGLELVTYGHGLDTSGLEPGGFLPKLKQGIFNFSLIESSESQSRSQNHLFSKVYPQSSLGIFASLCGNSMY